MSRALLVVDTNLLVLLVVGTASPDFISKHKRLQDYTAEEFDALVALMDQFFKLRFYRMFWRRPPTSFVK